MEYYNNIITIIFFLNLTSCGIKNTFHIQFFGRMFLNDAKLFKFGKGVVGYREYDLTQITH